MARIIESPSLNLVGKQVRRIRKSKKISQQQLSNKLELLGVYVCRGSVSRIEDCLRTVTDLELCAIAHILGVRVTDLIEDPFQNNDDYPI